jgi:hypothetical protein
VSITKLSITLLFLALLLVTIIGYLIKPANFSLNLFFSLLAWSYFLVVINWYALIFSYADTKSNVKNQTKFGVLPSIGLQAIFFSILSLTTIIVFLSLNNFDQLPLRHWLLQFVLLGIFLSLTVVSLIAAKTAELPEAPNELRSKDDLLNSINEVIINLENEQTNQKKIEIIKMIRDSIKYSIPNLAVLKDIEKYLSIDRNIQILLEKSKKNEQIDENELNTMLNMTRICK